MKIAGFAQLHNELEKGNLENWFRCMNEVCDVIYIYDQNSTDGSIQFYEEQEKARVIFSEKNRFDEEIICKDQLLRSMQENDPDVDWIFWMDGDTILDGRLCNRDSMESFLDMFDNPDITGVSLGHTNLWRSDTYERTDSEYDYFDVVGLICLWKMSKDLEYDPRPGLHRPQFPTIGMKQVIPMLDYKLIHRGFATDESIIDKYNTYKSRGQKEWALERIVHEDQNLSVRRIPEENLPSWFEVKNDIDPRGLSPIKEKV